MGDEKELPARQGVTDRWEFKKMRTVPNSFALSLVVKASWLAPRVTSQGSRERGQKLSRQPVPSSIQSKETDRSLIFL
jgi:hypothetical protein